MADKDQALKYILIGVAITVGLGVCGVGSCVALVGGGAFWAYQALDAPAQEAQRFFGELRRGEIDRARQRTSARFRSVHTLAAFEALVRGQPGLLTSRDVSLPSRGMRNGRAHLAGILTTDAGKSGVEIELVQKGQGWQVDRLTVAGTPLEDHP